MQGKNKLTISQTIPAPTGEYDVLPSAREVVSQNFPNLRDLLMTANNSKETGWNLGIQNIVQALYDASVEEILPPLTGVERLKSIRAIETNDELSEMLLEGYPSLKEVERNSQFGIGIFAAWLILDAAVLDFNKKCEADAAKTDEAQPIIDDRVEDKKYNGEVTMGAVKKDASSVIVSDPIEPKESSGATRTLSGILRRYMKEEFFLNITLLPMKDEVGTMAYINCKLTTIGALIRNFSDFSYYSEYTGGPITSNDLYIGADDKVAGRYFIVFPL